MVVVGRGLGLGSRVRSEGPVRGSGLIRLPLLCSLLKTSPKVPTTPVKAKRVSTFQEFESNTSDAWDAGEDDDELLAMAAESLNSEVVMETAHRVLRDHSQRQEQHKLQGPPGPEPQPSAEPPPGPGSDLRLVKSVSESHTARPAGGRGARAELQFAGESPSMWTIRRTLPFAAGAVPLKVLKVVIWEAAGLPRQELRSSLCPG